MEIRSDIDAKVLLLCEDLSNVLQAFETQADITSADTVERRLKHIKDHIQTERRLIEEIGLPCRFIVDHFSGFLGEMEYSIGFQYGDIRSGRGLLNSIRIGEWGTVNVKIGDVELSWRDDDAQYMFYADRVIIRMKDSAKDDITFFFSYSFKYDAEQLRAYQDVQHAPQTLYWHESLVLAEDAAPKV